MFIRTVLSIATLSLAGSAMADDRDEARARMPKQIEWQGHYLVLQGENFLPVERGFATPNITIFEVEDDYLPTGNTTLETSIEGCAMGETKPQSVTDTGEARGALKAEVAADYASANAMRERNRQHCPEHLGEIYGSGSYVYDDAFNQLAGQDFDEGIDHWRGWRLHTDPVESQEIVIIGQGGAKREDDPALDIFNYDNGMIVDVLFDPDTYYGRKRAEFGEDESASPPELPVRVTGDFWNMLPSNTEGKELKDIGQISEELDAALKAAIDKALNRWEAVIVSRGGAPETFETAEQRLQSIRDTVMNRLGPSSKVTTISLGLVAPICDDADLSCWVMNRSTILYLRRSE